MSHDEPGPHSAQHFMQVSTALMVRFCLMDGKPFPVEGDEPTVTIDANGKYPMVAGDVIAFAFGCYRVRTVIHNFDPNVPAEVIVVLNPEALAGADIGL